MSTPSEENSTQQPQPAKLKHAMSWAYPMPYPMMLGGMMPMPAMQMHMHPMMYGMPLQPTQQPLPVPRKKKLDCYEIDLDRQIGTGFSSVVYPAVDTRNGEQVCIKAVDYVGISPSQKAMVINEIAVLKEAADC